MQIQYYHLGNWLKKGKVIRIFVGREIDMLALSEAKMKGKEVKLSLEV